MQNEGRKNRKSLINADRTKKGTKGCNRCRATNECKKYMNVINSEETNKEANKYRAKKTKRKDNNNK